MATKTWVAAAEGAASVDANWSGGTKPVAGDDILFDGTSSANCTFDLALALGAYSQAAGYGGIVSQAANFSVTSFSLAAGTYTGQSTLLLTCSGDFLHTGGTLTSGAILKLAMTGANKSISLVMAGSFYFKSITISGNCSISHGAYTTGVAELTVYAGKVFTLNTNLMYVSYWGAYSNAGTIAGASSLQLTFNADFNWTPGTITCPVSLNLTSAAAASATIALTGNLSAASLLLWSDHATYTATLSHGTNYLADITGAVTLNARAIMTQGTNPWRFTTFLQNGASSLFTQGGDVGVTNNFTVSEGTYDGDGVHYTYVGGVINTTGGTVDGLFRIMKRIIARSSRSRRSVSRG